VKLKRMSTSTAETAEYEGEYEGVKVRVTRLTDTDPSAGRLESRWDGYIWVPWIGPSGGWSLVAECYPSMATAVHEVQRWITKGPPR